MTLTAQPWAATPAVTEVRRALHAHLCRSDITSFDVIPPVSIIAEIKRIWENEPTGTESFVWFVNALLDGTGWVADEEVTDYVAHSVRIVLHRDI